jgi:hypothetical protein
MTTLSWTGSAAASVVCARVFPSRGGWETSMPRGLPKDKFYLRLAGAVKFYLRLAGLTGKTALAPDLRSFRLQQPPQG